MKHIKRYSDFINEKVIYTSDIDEDRITFIAKDNNIKIASITIELMSAAYWYFEDEFSEDDYDDMFPDDKVFKIEHLEVSDKHKGKGIAKILMNKVIDKAKELNYNNIYLNASPMGNSGLQLNDLVGFYESFGFKTILHQGGNAQMLLDLKHSINEAIKLNKQFWNWFGDSKVIDSNNKPLICYHGTLKKFNIFDKSHQVYGHHGKGFYFANKNYAEAYYGKNYLRVYLRINKLFDMYAEYTLDEIKLIFKNDYNTIEQLVNDELEHSDTVGGYLFYAAAGNDRLMKAGYDGIKHDYVYVVFEPNQIKSVENVGTWSLNDDDIYK